MADAPKQTDRDLLLSLIASLTLCDHMGDVSSDVALVLKRLGIDIEWDEWHELGRALGSLGVRTLYGTLLTDDDDEDGSTAPREETRRG